MARITPGVRAQRADSFLILRRKPIDGYNISFLVTCASPRIVHAANLDYPQARGPNERAPEHGFGLFGTGALQPPHPSPHARRNQHLEMLIKAKLIDFIIKFMEDIDKVIRAIMLEDSLYLLHGLCDVLH